MTRIPAHPLLLCAIFSAILLFVPAVQAQQTTPFVPLPSVPLPPDLDRVLRDYEQAWQAGDELALAALFVQDGFVPSRQGWVRGRAAIADDYQNGSGDLRLRALGYGTENSMGYIIGAYNYGEPVAGARDRGNFTLVLQRDASGRWMIVADIDKSNEQ